MMNLKKRKIILTMEDLLLILPEDVLLIIFNKLDLYTKLSYIHVCKTLNYIIYDKNDIIQKIRQDQTMMRTNIQKIKSIITRNLCVDDYILHGECELCNKNGFLRNVEKYCICLEHCIHTCNICNKSMTYNNNNKFQMYPNDNVCCVKCRKYRTL